MQYSATMSDVAQPLEAFDLFGKLLSMAGHEDY